MRTGDFSRAPVQARAEALVVVEGRGRAWARTLRRSVRASAGHVWDVPLAARDRDGRVRGRVVCFTGPAEAAAFVAGLDPRGARWRTFRAEAQGYSNGVWRAEGDVMAHVERFTPLTGEVAQGRTPPLVAPAPPRTPSRRGTSRRPAGAATDPDRATTPAGAGAMFLGATRYRGPHAWAVLSREWYPMVADMRRMKGYVWHRVYWQAPFTLGTLAFFTDRDALMLFARVPGHRRLMTWITRDRRHGTGGYIRVHVADGAPGGER